MTIEIITDATGGTPPPAIVAALILLATASLLPALLAYFWGEKKPIAAAMNILCIVTGITSASTC